MKYYHYIYWICSCYLHVLRAYSVKVDGALPYRLNQGNCRNLPTCYLIIVYEHRYASNKFCSWCYSQNSNLSFLPSTNMTVQLMLHLRITFDNFADIFLICLNYIFDVLYFKSNVSTLSISCIIFTNLIFWNNIYENVSIRPHGSIWYQRLHFPFTCFYLIALIIV